MNFINTLRCAKTMKYLYDDFYSPWFTPPVFQAVGVSSVTGAGVAEFFGAVEAARTEYER
jgi:hypothetical protein